MTPTPEWYACDDAQMMTIPTMVKGETAFIITGDVSRNKIQTMPGGGQSTVAIELPAAWDRLMEEKGYPPLTDMYLEALGENSGDIITEVSKVKSASGTGPGRGNSKTRYYNLKGQRSSRPFNGVNIRVTTQGGQVTDVTKSYSPN